MATEEVQPARSVFALAKAAMERTAAMVVLERILAVVILDLVLGRGKVEGVFNCCSCLFAGSQMNECKQDLKAPGACVIFLRSLRYSKRENVCVCIEEKGAEYSNIRRTQPGAGAGETRLDCHFPVCGHPSLVS